MRMTRLVVAVATLLVGTPTGVASADTRVTNDTSGAYARYDGVVDATMSSCSTGRRTQNEPSVAVDPTNPLVIVAGSNDYCAEIENGSGNVWAGYYRSTDGGATWSNSLVPGLSGRRPRRPARASPTQGTCAAAGDPTQSFDGAGRLYYGFICFNRAKPTNGSIYVARYDDHGATYVRTVRVERGTPVGVGPFPGQDQHRGGPERGYPHRRQRLRGLGPLQRPGGQQRPPVLALNRRRAQLLQAAPADPGPGRGAVRRHRGRVRTARST